MEALRNWGRALLDFAYPPHCAVCEAEIAAAEMLCPPCWAEIGTGSRFVCGRDTAFEQIAVLGDFTGALHGGGIRTAGRTIAGALTSCASARPGL